MVEFVSADQMRATATSIASADASVAAVFSAKLHDQLYLDHLTTLFIECTAPLGVAGHGCYAAGPDRRHLFGASGSGNRAAILLFPVRGWDGLAYEVELALADAPSPPVASALHAIAALYLLRGIALLDAADDEPPLSELSDIERLCLDQSRDGRCDLDIGEDIGRSAHAVRIHLERADAKLRPAIFKA